MSIKSDKWIRRMAETAAMIEPFAPELVRANGSGRIVSYGTSSYGYDVRVANEFKIFTNINSTIVDPKDFDARNFVDFTGEVCIIPPNSFALARIVKPLPVEIERSQHPEAGGQRDDQYARADQPRQVENHPAMFAETLAIECQARVRRDHVVIAQQPQVEREDGPEQLRLDGHGDTAGEPQESDARNEG